MLSIDAKKSFDVGFEDQTVETPGISSIELPPFSNVCMKEIGDFGDRIILKFGSFLFLHSRRNS